MQINRLLAVLIVFTVSALTGCAGYTPRIAADEKPTANDAYLYGRFFIQAEKKKLAFDGYATMGFGITCTDGPKYTVRFSNEAPLQVIKIMPSTCSLVDFVYTNADGAVRSRKAAPEKLMKNVKFDAGKAYYLGDFAGESVQSGAYTQWNVKSMKDDYEKTSAELKTAFPNFSSVPTENRMIGK
jgi:hypothetical protein